MVSLEQFHENIWKMFFSSKKTLEEALEVYESMSIESKSIIALIAFNKDSGKFTKDKNGNDVFELSADPEYVQNFTLLCKQKEEEGFFDNEVSEVEKLNLIFEEVFKPNEEPKK